jgi:vancomycin aglycone glucosyltransferase
MRIVFAPIGTRGDVQPLLELAGWMRMRGHDCLFVAPEPCCGLIRSQGFQANALAGEFISVLGQSGQELRLLKLLGAQAAEIFDLLHRVCQGADAIVGAMLQFAAPTVAHTLRLPYFYVVFCPVMLPNSSLPLVGVPAERLPRMLNLAMHKIGAALWNYALKRALNRERARRGFAPVGDTLSHIVLSGTLLCAFDEKVAPLPAEYSRKSAPGFWHPSEDKPLDARLEEFVNQGPPPIYVGFGSQRFVHRDRLPDIAMRAVSLAGCRAVVQSGDGAVTSVASNTLLVEYAPHRTLFRRVAAVVHHGGAGTFAAAVRCGTPQIIIPHYADQFYWAYRARRLAIGPKPLLNLLVTAGPLARTIRSVLATEQFRLNAERLAAEVAERDGLIHAAETIESHVAQCEFRRH